MAKRPGDEIVVWNTGRKYTEHGQRMAAKIVGNTIYVVDIDRGLDMMFPLVFAELAVERDFIAQIMAMYDKGMFVSLWTFQSEETELHVALIEAAGRL